MICGATEKGITFQVCIVVDSSIQLESVIKLENAQDVGGNGGGGAGA